MDLQKLLLYAALAFTLMLLWQAWQQDYGPQPPQQQAAGSRSDAPPAPGADTPSLRSTAPGDAPSITSQGLESAQRIRVRTDVFDAEIDTVGGDLRSVRLVEYPIDADKPDVPVELLSDGPRELFIAQTGLLGAGDSSAPDHHARFQAAQDEYALSPGEEVLEVPLRWTTEDGVTVTKVYSFRRGSYLVDVSYRVSNAGAEPWRGRMYRQLQRTEPSESSAFIYTYTGGVIYSEAEKYEKISFDDMRDTRLERTINGGWAAMIEHYFLAAWIPAADQQNHYYSRVVNGDRYVLGMYGPEHSVAAGETAELSAALFVGPKLQERLEEIATGLELTVDYGFLTVIAKPLFWLLDLIHDLVQNWGWAIIILTLIIKLVFYKLSETSYKSMAQMRKLQPRLVALKERYGDDRQKLNEAMMKMYKEEKINPLGGCLPILVQIPVFIALYWVLLESVEMRQADFILWLNDLSSPDPFYVLPIIMGVTMLIQHRLNPTPLDPIQARVMMVLPLVFTVFFAFFPAGLVLYWVANNALSIAQQYYITRFVIKA